MSYYIDEGATSLDALQARLEATDLVPSHRPLLEGMAEKKGLLKGVGVQTLADLRVRLKRRQALDALAKASGIASGYLVLLRRVVEGFFPKPQPLQVFEGVEREAVVKLACIGVKNTQHLYEAVSSGVGKLAKEAGVTKGSLMELVVFSQLVRIQWVSPTFARVLVAAGFTSVAKLRCAQAKALYEAVIRANESNRFYKGTVGVRDMQRLITAAKYVP